PGDRHQPDSREADGLFARVGAQWPALGRMPAWRGARGQMRSTELRMQINHEHRTRRLFRRIASPYLFSYLFLRGFYAVDARPGVSLQLLGTGASTALTRGHAPGSSEIVIRSSANSATFDGDGDGSLGEH